MKADPLRLTDRPWMLYPGVSMLLLGILMFGLRTFVLPPPRDEEMEVWFLLTEMAFLAAGLVCSWLGRPALLEEQERRLTRGRKVVRDLRNVQAVVVYRATPEDLAHHVILIEGGEKEGEPDLAAQLLERHPAGLDRLALHALTGAGDRVYFAAEGVRLAKAYPLAAELGQRLSIPVLGVVGEHYAEIVPDDPQPQGD